jgi:hypothetical protein
MNPSGTPYFVQVESSEPDIDEEELLRYVPKDLSWATSDRSSFLIKSSALTLFDAADSGAHRLNTSLVVSLPIGRYSVASGRFAPTPKACFIVHPMTRSADT